MDSIKHKNSNLRSKVDTKIITRQTEVLIPYSLFIVVSFPQGKNPSTKMSCKRHILPKEKLRDYGAVPLYATTTTTTTTITSSDNHNNDIIEIEDNVTFTLSSSNGVTLPCDSDNNNNVEKSEQQQQQQEQNQEEERSPIGISIHGWDISSFSPSHIANEHEMDALTSALQAASLSSLPPQPSKSQSLSELHQHKKEPLKRKPKRLCPPEIVFLQSHVMLKYQNQVVLQFDAESALLEWARAHQGLDDDDDDDDPNHDMAPMNHNDNNNDDDDDNNSTTNDKDDFASTYSSSTTSTSASASTSSSSMYRGISIIQTKDAKLWKQKRTPNYYSTTANANANNSHNNSHNNNNNATLTINEAASTSTSTTSMIGTSSEFHFDWTYSTPYAGSGSSSAHDNDNHHHHDHPHPWIAQTHSGIQSRMHLLTDTTQPILFFHDIPFYEDDMHDNGDVSLSVKIRVMPTSFFILCRLYVRVDDVLIRCRDTRILYEFPSSHYNHSNPTTTTTTTTPPCPCPCIYRDICWREASWEELKSLNLPLDVRMWRMEGEDPAAKGRLQSLLNRLPIVSLPENLPAFSRMEIPSSNL